MSDTVEHFRGGYAPRGIHRGRLALPIHSEGGELLAYVGIDLDDRSLHFPKNFTDTAAMVLNAHLVDLSQTVFVVTHPITMLYCFEAGVDNVLVPLHDDVPLKKYLEGRRVLTVSE